MTTMHATVSPFPTSCEPRRSRNYPAVMANPTIRRPADEALPKITLVTACRNHADFLEATLVSVLEQGYPNLEYIVMDGCSDDASTSIIRRYERYLAHWQSQPDRGPYHALQAGLARSTGEIMGWLNADDMLHRNALWSLADVFSQLPQVEWITGTPMLYDPQGRTYVPRCRNRWSRTRYLRGDYQFIQQESTFWRRSLWERAGGRLETRYRLAADMELWMRFFRHAPLHTAEILVGGFRKRDESLSRSNLPAYLTEAREIFASEPRTAADRARLARLDALDRWRRWIPPLRKSWRVRQHDHRLHEYPPVVAYNEATARFELREEPT